MCSYFSIRFCVFFVFSCSVILGNSTSLLASMSTTNKIQISLDSTSSNVVSSYKPKLVAPLAFTGNITYDGQSSGTSGNGGSYFGYFAGNVTTGKDNTFLGSESGRLNITGYDNVYIGVRAGSSNINGLRNTFVGYQSGTATTSSYNAFFGAGTGMSNTTGQRNTFIGYWSANLNTTGSYNTTVGFFSLQKNMTGSYNTVLGHESGFNNVSGSGNVFIGNNAGRDELGSDKLYISNSSTASPLIYGDFLNSKLVFNSKVSIGSVTFPSTVGSANVSSYLLFVKGGILTDEIRVRTGWADYVFQKGYDLKTLEEVESYINENGHLPNVPSAEVVEQEGLEIGNIVKIQQEKIEELTLYIISQEKRMKKFEEEIDELKKFVSIKQGSGK